ncbi:hypothetical protein HQ45_03555 [Porphyromonas crevioricanis]|uniref:Uncharacterized protein n=2 Tax=Porphyromonas crevioricanis TaxID=393921 RepID=A0A0A2FVK3_9PORP|nr:hypothetical protein [Porphyromonas crevioricanis]KGN89920.1 hypothetical protein HQ45_03555 [Porphyromonas crevioricanis]KGN94105.1 hypothetical protein HQ38_06050 [Porphyromonas crevioricanis]SJZ65725.1 hypothetical protein SAMN02745203_00450 [Porphyromonas crevioricanis]SQH73912.1 Uncharacterised protein [Porphyromonas crevioricanis]GAD04752.1 hypothetical protein PORCRE_448 [Porphyromonas crevioricanis JCM 15906]
MKTTLIVLVITLLLLVLGVFLMAVKVFFVKGGSFPTGHVSDVPALRRKGIQCHRSQMQQAEERMSLQQRINQE